jgi:putative ABC transport system permease protein
MSDRKVRGAARAALDNVLFALRALVDNRLRSSLTLLGIVIGVATVIGMVSIIEGFRNNVVANFERFGSTLVQFQKFDIQFGPPDPEIRQRKNLTVEDAKALKKLCPSMKAVSPERYWFGGFVDDQPSPPDVKYAGREGTPDTIAGVTEDYAEANNHFVVEGRFISRTDVRRGADVTVLGYLVAQAVLPNTDPIGKRVQIGARRYTVIGVMEEQPATFFESTDLHVYMPISTFDSHFPWVKRDVGVNIATVPKRPEWVDRITEEGVSVLRARRGVAFNEPNDFGILTPDQMIRNFQAVTGGITLAMILISAIALLIGGVGVMNIMLVTVTERTPEIGVRKAVGAVQGDIVFQFLTEAMTLAALGGAIGVALGYLISLTVRSVSPLATATPLWSIVVGLLVSMSIGLIFGVYPAYKAARLDPIEALHYE